VSIDAGTLAMTGSTATSTVPYQYCGGCIHSPTDRLVVQPRLMTDGR